jgi:hypothetical protein
MTVKINHVREIDRDILEHLDPARKMFAEWLIHKGEWRIKPEKSEGDYDEY